MLSVVKGLTFPPSRLGPVPTTGSTIRHFVPQVGQLLLITDSPASSAQFLVQAVLQSQLKREGEASGTTRACVLVSVDHDFAHISAIAARSVSPVKFGGLSILNLALVEPKSFTLYP
jgi:hypothetical protein